MVFFSSYAFADAAEDRTNSVINSAINSKYSSATAKDYTVGNVVVKDGILSADIKQKVIVDGSSSTVGTKVSIPANDAFYKQSAKYAKSLLKSSAYAYAASVGMETLLRGVDYVMGEGGQIQKKPSADQVDPQTLPCSQQNNCAYAATIYIAVNYEHLGTFSSIESSIRSACSERYGTACTTLRYDGDGYSMYVPKFGGYARVGSVRGVNNPNYQAGSTPPKNAPTNVSDSEIDDAFTNWFKNNPTSVTDPVNTYIYSGKTSNGTPVSHPLSPPSFGQNTITDEMMNNYLENRDAQLRSADDQARREAIHSDSTKPETDDSPKTSTKNETLADGSTRKTETKTETQPDGSVKTTEIVTTTKPDGTTSVTTSEQVTSPVTEQNIPPACEYLAFLCRFTDWFQKSPEQNNESTELDITNPVLPNVNTSLLKVSQQCPPDFSYDFPLPFGGHKNITYSYSDFCYWLSKLYYIVITCAWVAAYFIVLGMGKKENG